MRYCPNCTFRGSRKTGGTVYQHIYDEKDKHDHATLAELLFGCRPCTRWFPTTQSRFQHIQSRKDEPEHWAWFEHTRATPLQSAPAGQAMHAFTRGMGEAQIRDLPNDGSLGCQALVSGNDHIPALLLNNAVPSVDPPMLRRDNNGMLTGKPTFRVSQSPFPYAETPEISLQHAPESKRDDYGLGLVQISPAQIRPGTGEEGLILFYFCRFTESRALIKKGNVFEEIGQATQSSLLLHASVCALSSHYLEKEEAGEYRNTAMQLIWKEKDIKHVLGATIVLLQHAILSEDHRLFWSSTVNILDGLLQSAKNVPGTFDYRMKLGSHAIFSGVTATKSQHFPKYNFLTEDESISQEIHGIGLSPELLLIIQDCNMLAFCDAGPDRDAAAYKILFDLFKLQQTCSVSDVRSKSEEELQVVMSTAYSYKHATILYVYYRILQTPPCAEMIGKYQDALITNLERTPTEGPTYKASWNLWGLFVASLGCFARSLESKTARVESEMVRVMSIWSGLRVNSSRSNVPPVLAAIDKIFGKRHPPACLGWWESYIELCGLLSLT